VKSDEKELERDGGGGVVLCIVLLLQKREDDNMYKYTDVMEK
jgi:hypothetical protein